MVDLNQFCRANRANGSVVCLCDGDDDYAPIPSTSVSLIYFSKRLFCISLALLLVLLSRTTDVGFRALFYFYASFQVCEN